jgi:hypothetical protein
VKGSCCCSCTYIVVCCYLLWHYLFLPFSPNGEEGHSTLPIMHEPRICK